jgi:hypothetical protein
LHKRTKKTRFKGKAALNEHTVCMMIVVQELKVLRGINQMLMICSSVAWYFYLNLKSLGTLNLNKCFSAA